MNGDELSFIPDRLALAELNFLAYRISKMNEHGRIAFISCAAIYRAYHQEREAKRCRRKLIHQNELLLERFQEDGVNTDYLIVKF